MNRLPVALAFFAVFAACASQPKLQPKPSGAPSRATPAASVQPKALPTSRASLGPIGTLHPIAVEAVSADGSWAVFCQARTDSDGDGRIEVRIGARGALEGDVLQRYLTLGGGEGQAIEELLSSDSSGRFVIVRRGGRVLLIDAHTSSETDLSSLGADTRSELALFRRHRAFGFDGSGARLIYLRKSENVTRAVVRSLGDGRESLIEAPAPDVYRAELDYSGNYALLHTLIDDTNGDGRLTWPSPEAKTPPPCGGPIASYPAWYGRGDVPVVAIAASTGGKAHPTPGFVTMLGDDLVLREPTGRLVLDQKGTRIELATSKCGARIVHTDAERKLLVIACTGPKGRPKLELVGAGFRQELGIDVGAWTDDRPAGPATRLVAIHPGNDATLLDLEQKKLIPLESGDRIAALWQTRALVRRKRGLVLFDAISSETQSLSTTTLPLADTITKNNWAVVPPLVVDLARARVLGRIDGRPLAIAPDGRVLVAEGGSADGTRLAGGPLTWRSPTPIDESH